MRMERVAFLCIFLFFSREDGREMELQGFHRGLSWFLSVCMFRDPRKREKGEAEETFCGLLCGVFVHGKIESERERSEMTGFHSGFCGTCGIFRVFVCKGVGSGEEMGEREGLPGDSFV